MNKKESLFLLAQLEGFIIGKFGDHCLPDWVAEELTEVCELLSKKVSE